MAFLQVHRLAVQRRSGPIRTPVTSVHPDVDGIETIRHLAFSREATVAKWKRCATRSTSSRVTGTAAVCRPSGHRLVRLYGPGQFRNKYSGWFDVRLSVTAALGISLLFHLALAWGLVITAVVTIAILTLGKHGFRPLELVIGGLVTVIGLSLPTRTGHRPAELARSPIPHICVSTTRRLGA
jgi:Natural resistance-associated macrophage protein